MKCPYCAHLESKVVDSRPADEGSSIRRRRECLACRKRFTTYEIVESLPLMVIKRDGSRQAFDKSKLLGSMLKSCEKRSVSMSTLEGIANEIEQSLQNEMVREVPSTEIGELVMERLKDVDEVSYVRFASVYRQFKDINTFMAELTKLLEEKGWPAFDWRDMGQAERAIGQRRRQVMDLLYQHCPDPQLIEVFRLKYDYHNIKAILKGDAQRVAQELYYLTARELRSRGGGML